ncbi:SbtR family transcriptional regulator [Variovorax sp. JS1663]|uniref:SbtR family transcriptional regulator n=1 Tax=Variovorax sp. JS1663 TaxID=1851577 RepID=UPI00192CF8FC|nr:hypothetical protein [Variovorax sp. JS1663]
MYKYFSTVEAILMAWHERQVTRHLEHFAEVRAQPGGAYALISYQHHGTELAALLHRGEHVARAHHQLSGSIRNLLTEAAETGDVRDDVAPGELEATVLHALAAVSALPSKAAVRRLVAVTLAGLHPRAPCPQPQVPPRPSVIPAQGCEPM